MHRDILFMCRCCFLVCFFWIFFITTMLDLLPVYIQMWFTCIMITCSNSICGYVLPNIWFYCRFVIVKICIIAYMEMLMLWLLVNCCGFFYCTVCLFPQWCMTLLSRNKLQIVNGRFENIDFCVKFRSVAAL